MWLFFRLSLYHILSIFKVQYDDAITCETILEESNTDIGTFKWSEKETCQYGRQVKCKRQFTSDVIIVKIVLDFNDVVTALLWYSGSWSAI